MKQICLALLLSVCLLGGCQSAKTAAPAASPADATQTAQASQTEAAETSAPGAPLFAGGEACGPDGLACPLAKPVKNMTKQYDRTPEQIARMEAFDGLTLEEKFMALDEGLIVCTEFIHDEQWEHVIDQKLIDAVGEEPFQKWQDGDYGCHSIYDFAPAFAMTYADLEKLIREQGLEGQYPLDALKAGMEKWCA